VFGAATLAGVPPPEAGFDMNNYANVEGPVWIGDALYFSEMLGGSGPPPSRILKMTEAGTVTVALSETSGPDGKGPGSNGLAVDASGQLYAAVHKDGSVDKVNLTTGVLTPVASMYNGARFDSPNDLAIASNGWIYFSDPDFQAPSTRPQPTTHLYRVSPTGTVTADGTIGQNQLIMAPNGVTLSLDEATLFVSGNSIYKFPVNADGSLGMGTQLVAAAGDGMVLDCAGNLYVAGNNQSTVQVYDGTGKIVGTITLPSGAGTTTNVAFGGATHQTLYITAMGNDGQRGVFKFAMNLPGMPY
jgi:gluconolactonase